MATFFREDTGCRLTGMFCQVGDQGRADCRFCNVPLWHKKFSKEGERRG